jgi:hypothetical protein
LSSFFGLYLAEGILTFDHIFSKDKYEKFQQNRNIRLKNDIKTKLQIYEDLKREGSKVILYVAPASFISDSDQEILPLSSMANTKTILGNENGYNPIYQSDRYGFNNPDEEWDKKQIEFLLVGDSFTQGLGVNEPDTIAGNLRRLLSAKSGVLNLGHGSNGPLIEYATLREYMPLMKTKKVLWIYYEANDLTNLSHELENKILLNYLNDQHFTQNLKLKQNKIDIEINEKFLKEKFLNELNLKLEEKSLQKMNFLYFLKLYKVRKITLEKFFSSPNPKFKEIMNLSKEFVESNGAKIYFVYLPGYERYDNTLILQDASKKYNKVIKIIKNLKIPIIDINKDLFEKHKDPLSLFPSANHHYNELGYKLVADTIFKKIFEPESIK